MKIRLIRNATLQIDYGLLSLVIDPYLAPKHSRPSFRGKSPNPLVELPCSPAEVLAGADAVLVSHLHSDHFDPAAEELLPKETPVFCRPGDAGSIRQRGFQQVFPVADRLTWKGLTLSRTPCQHGSGDVLSEMGEACGFLLEAESEPTIYWAGDTIWNASVAEVIDRVRPPVIVTHSAGAVWGHGVLIIMDAAQTVEVCRAAPWSTVVATHMEALDHATVSRQHLRRYATAHGIGAEQLRIPADGETLEFEAS